MQWFSRFFTGTSTLGALIAALGCAACFPALGSLGLALGLGFLALFEGLFINTLLPIFVCLAIIVSVLSFVTHRKWYRLLMSIAGPVMILLTLYPLWTYSWSTYLFYSGLVVMACSAIVDIVFPPSRQCASETSPDKSL